MTCIFEGKKYEFSINTFLVVFINFISIMEILLLFKLTNSVLLINLGRETEYVSLMPSHSLTHDKNPIMYLMRNLKKTNQLLINAERKILLFFNVD